MTPTLHATTPAREIPGVAPLAALVTEALGHWLAVARQVESGAVVLWSPELEQLTDRLHRLTRQRALADALRIQHDLDWELRRLRDAWMAECIACIVAAIHEDPLVICS